jgi:hypothetical protein
MVRPITGANLASKQESSQMKAEETATAEHPFVSIDKDLSMIYFAM